MLKISLVGWIQSVEGLSTLFYLPSPMITGFFHHHHQLLSVFDLINDTSEGGTAGKVALRELNYHAGHSFSHATLLRYHVEKHPSVEKWHHAISSTAEGVTHIIIGLSLAFQNKIKICIFFFPVICN